MTGESHTYHASCGKTDGSHRMPIRPIVISKHWPVTPRCRTLMTFSGEDTRISLAGQASPKVIGECLVSIDPIMTKGTRKQGWLEVELTLHYSPIKTRYPLLSRRSDGILWEANQQSAFGSSKKWCLQGKPKLHMQVQVHSGKPFTPCGYWGPTIALTNVTEPIGNIPSP